MVEGHQLGQAIYIDRDLWEKVILNLVSNAFKFTLAGKVTVAVRPAPEGSGAEVVVADTGVGISELELPRLFERFYRVANAQGRSYEGSGIGLALVRELVELHGGTISVESRLGAGSAFTIRLPFGAAHLPSDRVRETEAREANDIRRAVFLEESSGWLEPAQSAAAVQPLSADAVRARVLLADDSADMRQYVARLLLAEGYEVEAAADGDAALRLARMRPPDLVLADVMMPRLDGLALLRALREEALTVETPVILLSARAGEEAKVEGLQLGADDYLVKPFSARELLARLQAAIRLAKVRREANQVLREESLRVLRLLERAPSFICVLRGPDHVFEFANAAYRRIVGQREVIGRSVREAIPEAVDQGYIELLDRVYAGERFFGEAMPLELDPGPDGMPATSILDFIYEPIVEADGTISGVFVEGYEVTARVRAELALRSSEEQLRLATDAAEVGLWDLDAITGALYWPARSQGDVRHFAGCAGHDGRFFCGLASGGPGRQRRRLMRRRSILLAGPSTTWNTALSARKTAWCVGSRPRAEASSTISAAACASSAPQSTSPGARLTRRACEISTKPWSVVSRTRWPSVSSWPTSLKAPTHSSRWRISTTVGWRSTRRPPTSLKPYLGSGRSRATICWSCWPTAPSTLPP